MRTLFGLFLSALLGATLSAQVRHGGTRPGLTGGFGNVVFPGGTAAQPGVTRGFGNVAFPGTGGPRLHVPFSITDPTFAARLSANVAGRNVLRESAGRFPGRGRGSVYAFPVFIGGGYYEPPQPVQQAPNITVIYPPQQTPVIINQFGMDATRVTSVTGETPLPETVSVYQAPVRASSENAVGQSMGEPPAGYLIAFKDNTVYSAVAYWVEGEILHYFTSGNNHNQVSLSLIDRDLTERLNKERGTEIRLPR